MARPVPENTLRERGTLTVNKNREGAFMVIFTPPTEALPRGYNKPEDCKKLIARVNPNKTAITFYPFKVWGLHTMESRYYSLESIEIEIINYQQGDIENIDVEEMLSDLPSVFIRDYNYGLGFLKEYRHIVTFTETLQVKHLIISKSDKTAFDREKAILVINERDFNILKKHIDSITARARKIASVTKNEVITEVLLDLLGHTNSDKHGHEKGKKINERLTKHSLIPLHEVSKKKRDEAVEIVRANTRTMLEEQPDRVVKLRTDIDLVTLEELVRKFEEMIGKDLKEFHWQKLFEANPFILNMAFGVPIVKVRGHAYVGGRKISGAGDKIADFLVKNSISNNAAIIEIKKPATKLLSSRSYRNEVLSPSSELSGAVNQILDQIHKFQKNIATLKEETKNYDIETYSVMGVLVVGRSLEDVTERKSFELFRGNSKNIHIITFDELLEKLKQLKIFLSADESFFIDEEDLPF